MELVTKACDIVLKCLIEHFSVSKERHINQQMNMMDIGDKKNRTCHSFKSENLQMTMLQNSDQGYHGD